MPNSLNQPSRPTTGRAPKRPTNARPVDDEADDSTWMSTRVFIIVLAASALIVGIYIQAAKNISEKFNKSAAKFTSTSSDPSSVSGSTHAIHPDNTLVIADHLDAGYLDHVIEALNKFGLKLTYRSPMLAGSGGHVGLEDFSLIWTHDYPFTSVKKLRPHQRINHFPGTGFITNKLTLSTTPQLPHMLKAFRLPAERDKFVAYTAQVDANKNWIQKTSSHRGISIETAATVKLDTAEDTLVQEYMSNPLLIDGKKFDIGIYAVLTSVEPLRVYIYDAEALLRFCAKHYLDRETGTFNGSDVDSYVVGDDYTPIWLMPSLVRYYIGANLSMKQTLNAYLRRERGLDGDKIWGQIEATIKQVYKRKEPHMGRMARMYQEANNYNSSSARGSLGQFFELVRFDFIVDEQLNVYLMEANMSPNLSSRHFPPNRLLYEQVLQSYLSLVGLSQFGRYNAQRGPVQYADGSWDSAVAEPGSMNELGRHGLDEIVADKDLSVAGELCVSDECHMYCELAKCRVCSFCMSYSDKLQLRRAVFEHNNRWNFKRLLPSTADSELDWQLENVESRRRLAPEEPNAVHVAWFRAKCALDGHYC